MHTAERVAPRGWHVQVFASLPLLGACSALLASLPVPVVLDHYAGAHAALGLRQTGLSEVLALVEAGQAYVKLSAPYRCTGPQPLGSLAPLTRLLLATNPERMLWGSDWPHPQPGLRATPQEVCPPFEVPLADVLQDLRSWVPDADALQKLFVDNPARLYGFGA